MTDTPEQPRFDGDAVPPAGGGGDELSVYRQVFVEETREELETLVEALLKLEDNALETSALNEAFRLVHSMKGSSAMMGFTNAGRLAHVWEDLLDQVRGGHMELTRDHVDLMLECVDAFRDFVETLATNDTLTDADAEKTEPLVESLQAALAESEGQEAPAQATEPSRGPVSAVATTIYNNFELSITFDARLQLPDLKAKLIASRLSNFGEIVTVEPDFDESERFEAEREFRLAILTQSGIDEIRQNAMVDGVASIDIAQLSGISPLTTGAAAASPPEAPQMPVPDTDALEDAEPETQPDAEDSPAAAAAPSETIRVEIRRLDWLMNLTGELVVSQERFREIARRMRALFHKQGVAADLRQIAESLEADESHTGNRVTKSKCRRDEGDALKQHAGAWDEATRCYRKLTDAVDQLERVSDDLQRAVMETRMVPLAPLFNRFKRVVRDLANGTGKTVQLKIRGEKTELDKRMIDELADPLIHLIRNAIDHGLETPAEREAAGKPPTGTITLSAAHRGNNVYISVADDGRGLDIERIRARIIERNLAAEHSVADLTDQQVMDHIWSPGFSTASRITDISGRGVGMDIVRSRINALCGTIEIDSELERGTTVTVKLPLTLAIIPSLLLRIGDGAYSVPLEEVREIAQLDSDRLISIHGRRAVELRGEFVPVIGLKDVFRWPVHASGSLRHAKNSLDVVVMRVAGNSVGLEVDAPMGVAELVVKSLSDNFLDVSGLSGASVLGTGEISLMLDSAALVELAKPGEADTSGGPA